MHRSLPPCTGKKIRLFPVLAFLFSGLGMAAQEVPVTIKVSSTKKEPIPFASIVIRDRNDSINIVSLVADSSGVAQFKLEKNQQYWFHVTAANYKGYDKGVQFTGKQTHFPVTLEILGKTLETAVVRATKPLMKQEDDKTIVEPEVLAATSTNGYEVIEKTPGLFVDQDGNIYISSMTPATVQINGRDMKMSAQDIATMLKNLPPNSIARIEIVKTPSAKYDASGSGGVVNVVLKKGVKIGLTGSINTGWQQGTYGNEFLGFNLNNNDGRKTAYFNFNFGKRDNFERIKTDRSFAPDSMLSQDALTRYPGHSVYTAFGITWELNKKWELTYDGNLNYNKFDNSTRNDNRMFKISNAQTFSHSLNQVNNEGFNLTLGSGFETKYKIDSLGSEWTNDTYYSHSESESNQVFSSLFYVPSNPGFGGDGRARNNRDFVTARSDLKLRLKKKFTFETGIQVTYHQYHNRSNYFNEIGGVRTKDLSRTNTFKYTENINSLYLQGSKTLGKDLVIKFGTRLENTNMKGRQYVPGDTSFTIRRTDLFPYVYLSKKVMSIAGFELRGFLVYRRSIRRPFYDQLNPFPRYIDQFLTEIGNPALRPQFTHNYEANISVDERPILAVGINDTRDIFSNVIIPADTSSKVNYRTYDNVGKNKEWYLRALGALPPGGTYFFVLGAQYNHNFYQGTIEKQPLSYKRGTWTLFTYHSLKLGKLSAFTMNGFVRFKGQQQFYELSTFGSLNMSVNRKFLKEKLVVTLSGNDIFRSNKNDFVYDQGSVHAVGYRMSDSRRFGINLRYNFGIRKREENGGNFDVEPGN